MKTSSQNNNDIRSFANLTLALIFLFCLMSLFELVMIKSMNDSFALVYLLKITNDFWAGLLIGLLLFPLYSVLRLLTKKNSIKVVKVLFVVVVIVQFALVKYSISTLLNLGADFLGYSFNDITHTVTVSETFSIGYFIPFVIFPLLFLFSYGIIAKYLSNINLIAGMLFLMLLLGLLKMTSDLTPEIKYQNKLVFLISDIIHSQKEKRKLDTEAFKGKEYPLLRPFSQSKDVLTPFFSIKNGEKPNVVIIIVEGLGGDFVGNGTYHGFTPYLDSLTSKSLYWENFVSNTGRTFGVVPSLLGSLPYGHEGFLELTDTPNHLSLISVLKQNGYTTSYYCGDKSAFDKKINFLEYNNIDHVVDEDGYGLEYAKTEQDSRGFSWGYPDELIFKKALASINSKPDPRLDIIMTLTNHEPFIFPSKEAYKVKIDSILSSDLKFAGIKKEVLANKDIFASLVYTDNSIKDFMLAYAKRKDYNNTVFIITGDHRLIPVTQKDNLCRYHVPLFIFSPMLKTSKTFKSVSSHWDIAPSLLTFLTNNYEFNKPEKIAWMSDGLDTVADFRNVHKIPLMRYKGNIEDYIYNDYLYSEGELYKMDKDFNVHKENNRKLLKPVLDSLTAFKQLNNYLTRENKIFPDSLVRIYVKSRKKFSQEQQEKVERMTKGMDFEQAFQLAREKAFTKEYDDALLLCDYILDAKPNHSDCRALKGRVLAWKGDYSGAEVELLKVIKGVPRHYDSYIALIDVYHWSKQEYKLKEILKKALRNGANDPQISFEMAKEYARTGSFDKANKIMDSIIEHYPEREEYLTFKETLK
ncbi:sulfatase-like hydrolase/transferase [Flavobacterium sp. NRK F10]|uniref:sulfatase-like hydrolase/transferase n=1 Tax=Flavobacterium sp. NRK F10 TaxID=2954931 RepID=UPI0020906579|nr:sulfatase-like hydrolase/transferase [Flavobacterium sp. NRK F10]MCO6175295.1 sulfatase-like hydrolase/transferase [Flavobacterium sp. NRK F10]